MNNSQICREALDVLRKNWIEPVVVCFLLLCLSSVCGSTVVLVWLVLKPAYYGFNAGLLQFVRSNGEEKLRVESLLSTFNKQLYGKIILLSIVKSLFIFLWLLLFIVPGIVKAMSYSMTPFVIADDADVDYREALDRSEAIMEGHKLDFFVIQLVYIVLIILSVVFTFGIGILLLDPYYETVTAKFYEQAKADYQSRTLKA